MPPVFDKLLDRMALSFETTFDQYCQSQRDHIHEGRLRNHLFRVVISRFILSNSSVLLLTTRRIVAHGVGSVLAQLHGFRGVLV
jgi:hypothetical protein